MDYNIPGFPVLHHLPELAQTYVHWVGDAIQPSHLLLSPSSPAFNFSNKSALHIRWPNYWSFSFIIPWRRKWQPTPVSLPGKSHGHRSLVGCRLQRVRHDWATDSFSIRPSNEYSGLISFRIDWFDLLAVQRTLKSLLQHHSSKAPILRHSAFFIVQLSHLYMTTGKTIALTRWTFVSKVTSLLFNVLSKFVITFLPRSKCLLISWMQSPSAVILEPKKIKSVTVSIVSPSIFHEVIWHFLKYKWKTLYWDSSIYKQSNTTIELFRFSNLAWAMVALMVKSLSANAGNAGDLSSIPGSGRSPGGGLQSMGSQRVKHGWVTNTHK